MSMKRLATMSAVGLHTFNSNNNNNNNTITYYTTEKGGHHQGLQTMRPSANLHGNVNIMLGGAMLSVVITVVCFVCYCCHRNIKKRSTSSTYRQRWLENDPNMEIYSVEQCYDTSALFMDPQDTIQPQLTSLNTTQSLQTGHAPPPSYEQVVAYDELAARHNQQYKSIQMGYNHEQQIHIQENYCPFAPTTSSILLNQPQTLPSFSYSIDSTECNDITNDVNMIMNLNLVKCDNDSNGNNINDTNNLECINSLGKNNNEIYINFNNNNNISCELLDSTNNILNLCRYCGKNVFCNLINNNSNINYKIMEKCRCTNITSIIGNQYNSNNNNSNEILDSNQHEPSSSTSCSSSNNNSSSCDYATTTSSNLNKSFHDCSNPLLEINENNNDINVNKIDFDNINENGLVRLDMSQIIDNTGLPTYEAALKLESSGYV